MSIKAIRAALETALSGISPAIAIAWENVEFTPANGVPFQRVSLGRAKPDNSESGRAFVEQGVLMLALCYPLGVGAADAEDRGDLVRTAFPKGQSFTNSGVTVTVQATPEVSDGRPVEDRYIVPVRIPWRAQVTG